jgi:hypothetical protein
MDKEVETPMPTMMSQNYKTAIGFALILAIFGSVLGIVALSLYATVPQPVNPTLKHKTVGATKDTSTTTFTPENYTYYTVTTTSVNNNVVVDKPSVKNFFYSIYNKSGNPSTLNVYNKGAISSSIATIAAGKAAMFLVNNKGISISTGPNIFGP